MTGRWMSGLGLVAGVVVALAGCASSDGAGQPAATPRAAPADTRADLSSPAVVEYDGFFAAVASRGDTVGSLAQRVGIGAQALGDYNGLPVDFPLREGDELVLPPQG